jgi:hypothetical protein
MSDKLQEIKGDILRQVDDALSTYETCGEVELDIEKVNWIISELEAKERERDYYKIKSSQLKEWNEKAQKVMDAAVSQNKRLREALDAIAELKILDIYEACEIARQALKGERGER